MSSFLQDLLPSLSFSNRGAIDQFMEVVITITTSWLRTTRYQGGCSCYRRPVISLLCVSTNFTQATSLPCYQLLFSCSQQCVKIPSISVKVLVTISFKSLKILLSNLGQKVPAYVAGCTSSAWRLRLCKGCHHTSICRKLTSNPNQPTNVSAPVITTQSNLTISTVPTLNPQAPAFISPPTSTSLYLACSRAVLLQTVMDEVYNLIDSSSTQKLRVILDNRSQQEDSIATSGATKGAPRHCDVVRIGIVTQSSQGEELELLTIPLDMSAPTFIRCLKRFTTRRGLPRKFISDNGKTAAKTLNEVVKQPQFTT